MTIALGIIAQDGIVIAADREEGDGYLKSDRGKILAVFRGRAPIGSFCVTGAGDGPPLDEVGRILGDTFCAEEDRSNVEAKEALAKEHRVYYKRVILPFVRQSSNERPDYDLIIGCFAGQTGKSLFATSKLAFNEVSDYEAVGVGATVANNWLDRLYDNLPVMLAIKLAAYVVYQVKNSVSGCGLGTNIFVLKSNTVFGRVNSALIRKWEEAFRVYPALERNIFSYCIGVEPSEARLLRTRPEKPSIDADIEKIRAALTQSDAQPLEQGP